MKNKSLILLLSVVLVSLFFMEIVSGDIFMGTCEGYVHNAAGSRLSNANVSITVTGCTSQNCNGTVLTDSNGYYVKANLNLLPSGWVSVTATKDNAYGTGTGQADSYQAAYVNITTCEAPYKPLITPIATTHNNSLFTFIWTSGTDPNGYSTYDIFLFDGTTYNASTSPQTKTNLNFTTYSWGVKTCNSVGGGCCSSYNSSSFLVNNSAPPIPVLVDQANTNNNTVTLNWTSGGADADGDSTYFNFKMDTELRSNVTSPQTVSNLSYGSHTWRVQECDSWECSSWASDSFSVTNNAPHAPNLTAQADTSSSSVSLSWVSVSLDEDGDPCHDEYVFNDVIDANAASPQAETLNATVAATYNWAVRTCDDNGACSAWQNDSFIYCYCTSSGGTGGSCSGGGGGGGGSYCAQAPLPAGYELFVVITVPENLYPGDKFDINFDFRYYAMISDLVINITSPQGITVDDLKFGLLVPNKDINVKLNGKIDDKVNPGEYDLYLTAYDADKAIVTKKLTIKVSKISTAMQVMRPFVQSTSCCVYLLYIIIFILLVILYFSARYLIKKLKKHR